jgi:hypothetical protein
MESRPEWAYNWCYFFAGMGIVSLITAVMGLTLYKKLSTPLLIASLLAALIQAATAFTLFYMCRSSLKPVNRLVSRF